jgi:two-component system, chemotaxis family, CheB/CheR fusion protein
MGAKKRKLTAPADARSPVPPDLPAAAQSPSFPVVGIGASAGGLAAFEAFFSAMPVIDPGMAFVLVQHLAPDHKSILTDLVKRYARMQVFEVEDGMLVQPNCAYIIPPNHDMAFHNGALQLLPPSAPRGHRLPIDFFFRSLAQDQHERAICIVLSGTGSDGTLGVRAVKGAGGMAMVQSPDSTEYDGMPRSAIATGLVDYVLPPAEMPAQLLAYAAHAFNRTARQVSAPAPRVEGVLAKVFVLVLSQTGHDFSGYKQSTIARRIQRRMAVHQIEQPDRYLEYLEQNPAEVDALARDFLIGVTSFFREPSTFLALETQVIPRMFAGKPTGSPVRVWVPGCSTGEEAYSIAMLLQEHVEELQQRFQLQVFATDIDRRAIEVARAGCYPASIAADLPPERLARHFVPDLDGASYRVTKSIRDMMIFSEQDVVRDPPFSRLDLVSCRNLLIYMGADLQKKLIPLLYYALKPRGFLTLGTSESIGEFVGLFDIVDRKLRIYQRTVDTYGLYHPAMRRYQPPTVEPEVATRAIGKPPHEGSVPLRELTERLLLAHYAPVGALVNQSGEIYYLHGRTGLYLEPAPGEASMNILKMAREGLRRDLSMALHTAAARKKSVLRKGVRVKTNGGHTLIHLDVQPVTGGEAGRLGDGLFLIRFEQAPAPDGEANGQTAARAGMASAEGNDSDANARIAALQQELRAKEEYLQSTIEEMETSGEELRSANEEMQSVNEELQSANEELETSKEELQSVNEELATVNAELQQRVTDLSRANNDMNNLLAGTGIGTIFVDHQLRIQRFTPAVTQVINLIQTDAGRPVGHIVSNLTGYTRLVEDVKVVLDTLSPREVEVETSAGNSYVLRIRPYRTLENVIEGAVITFFDITEMKRIREEQRLSEARVRQIAASLPHLVWTFGADGVCDSLGPQWVEYTGVPEAELRGQGWLKHLHPEDRDPTIAAWSHSIGSGTPFTMEFRIRRKDGVYRWFRGHIVPMRDGDVEIVRWFGAASDIDDQRQAEAALRDSEVKCRRLMEVVPQGVLLQDREGRITDANPAAERILAVALERMRNKQLAGLLPEAVQRDGSPFPWENSPERAARITGHPADAVVLGVSCPSQVAMTWLRVSAFPLCKAGESAPYPVCTFVDLDVPLPTGSPGASASSDAAKGPS